MSHRTSSWPCALALATLLLPGQLAWSEDAEPPLWDYFFPPHLRRTHPDDPARHVGLGYPLQGTSWRNRPYYAGWLVGGLLGDDLIGGVLGQQEDLFGGYRLGWDFDHYWGTEARFAFSHIDVTDHPQSGRDRTSRDRFYDLHLLHYPWGDAELRPYFTLGLGAAEFYVQDAHGRSIHETQFALPLGIGVKHYFRNWLALRLELMNNLSFASQQLDTMHNVSLDFGVEYRFGGRRTKYGW